MEPLVFDLLVYLIEHRDRVVTREELLNNLWQGKIVTDSALAARLKDARKAVQDSGTKQQIIKTIHGRGYQFIAVVADATSGHIPEKSKRDLFGEKIPLPEKPSIAILPFTNLSSDREQEFFGDGLTDDIITALAKLQNLLVIASESTLGYKGQSIDLAQVGRELGVHFVLEGSVRKLDNRIRVNAQLIEASSGRHQWADRYDRELEDIFTVQDEIVREIVVAMDVQLIEGEQARTLATGTANLEAWECVRLGMPDAVNATTGANLKAKELFERAIELDPGYAVAWVMLGWIYQQYVDVASVSTDAHSSESVLKSMQECAEKALAIDPDCSEACCLMAMYYLEVKNFEAAIEMSEKSVRLAPGNAENLCAAGLVMNKSGNPERGLEFIKRAMRASPRYRPGFLRGAGTSYFLLGQYETAMRYFEESITREPDYLAAHTYLVSVFCRLDRLPDARRSAQEVFRLSPNFSVSSYLVGLSFSNPDIVRRMRNELRRAGLPE